MLTLWLASAAVATGPDASASSEAKRLLSSGQGLRVVCARASHHACSWQAACQEPAVAAGWSACARWALLPSRCPAAYTVPNNRAILQATYNIPDDICAASNSMQRPEILKIHGRNVPGCHNWCLPCRHLWSLHHCLAVLENATFATTAGEEGLTGLQMPGSIQEPPACSAAASGSPEQSFPQWLCWVAGALFAVQQKIGCSSSATATGAVAI